MSFFKKVADSVNKGVDAVSTNSKAMMEKSKAKTAITNFENERRQFVMALGQKIYDNHAETGGVYADDTVESYIAEITRRLQLMQEQHDYIARIDAELAKPAAPPQPMAYQQPAPPQPDSYQQPMEPQPAAYQPPTEAPPAAVPPAVPQGAACTCGYVNPGGAKFCSGCGSPVTG